MIEKSITTMAQRAVLEGNIPAKQVAKEINKPYSTLLRELNPFDRSAKLGAETLLDIIRVTGNVDLLHYIADELGYDVVSRQVEISEEIPVRAMNF